MSNQAHSKAAAPEKEYFDLHTQGCGYLSRIRWVNPRKSAGRQGKPFLACAINALHGDTTDPSYSYFDVRVTEQDCVELVQSLQSDVDAGRKVFVAFKIGDIYPHSYTIEVKDKASGQVTQEARAIIKGRLFLLSHVKVDGETIYERPPQRVEPRSSTDG
ncbi:DUF3577 domain-containing protein [Azoarcus olearius]|uniref:DUF3577 domain-containing protein n=1 Tax=Azoarcus sp. (strain BH72) TaxID=418699 RepID=A1K750_AZOSB|nr:DUF3577 domain-containing protein [Azoarcus olearius]CAL94655.1 conserved hypothetical protein [Azoarcus olearius]